MWTHARESNTSICERPIGNEFMNLFPNDLSSIDVFDTPTMSPHDKCIFEN